MKEKLISFSTAKLAKERGFDWKCLYFYCMNSTCNHIDTPTEYSFKVNANFDSEDNFGYGKTWSAPTLTFLQQWLREKHDIDITIGIVANIHYDYYLHHNRNRINEDMGYYISYEEALEAGLLEALKLIT